MNIIEKAGAVTRVLNELDDEIKKFQSWSQLSCAFGCGRCCFKSDIEATPLEFLPFALRIFNEGREDAWFEKIEKNQEAPLCMLLDPRQLGEGLCTEYQDRGLVCRAFGFTARVNKYNRKELITCNVIKLNQPENYIASLEKINSESEVPIVSTYYMMLNELDPILARQFMPINKAILNAMQLMWQYFSYKRQENL